MLRIDVRPSRSYDPADVPTGSPVIQADRPDVTMFGCIVVPEYVVAAGLPRMNCPRAGVVAVSVPSGLTCQPRLISTSSKNGPQFFSV